MYASMYVYMLPSDSYPLTSFKAGQPILKPALMRVTYIYETPEWTNFQHISRSAHRWPCRPWIFDVYRQSKHQIHGLWNAPTYFFNSWPYLNFSRWTSPTVEAHDSPPFVFKKEGSVLVLCTSVVLMFICPVFVVCVWVCVSGCLWVFVWGVVSQGCGMALEVWGHVWVWLWAWWWGCRVQR